MQCIHLLLLVDEIHDVMEDEMEGPSDEEVRVKIVSTEGESKTSAIC